METERLHELKIRGLAAERDCLKREVAQLHARARQGSWGALRNVLGGRRQAPLDPIIFKEPGGRRSTKSRPLISLTVDVPNWAFANIALQLEAHLSDQFDFEIIPISELGYDPVLVLYLTRHSDLVHHLWRDLPLDAIHDADYCDSIDLYFGSRENLEQAIVGRTTFTVYDHLFLKDDEIAWRSDLFNKYALGYTVCSKRLGDIYESVAHYPRPSSVTQDGVDLDLFGPKDLERLTDRADRPLRVGWVGNSAWAAESFADSKGFRTILAPALDCLALEGVSLEAIFADRQKAFIPHAAMPDYYAKIDVLVCASEIEGTPNPVLEAMACGVPVISTDVGVVREVFGGKQRDFILEERSIECLTQKLRLLAEERSRLSELSQENLARISSWGWARQAEKFRAFFIEALARRRAWRVAHDYADA